VQPVVYEFQGFELLPGARVLRLHGKDVDVTPRAFDLLLALVERAGKLVPKNELFELVWPKRVVEESNLQVQIWTLRKLLGARAIATVPGRGYAFTLLPPAAAASPANEDQRGMEASAGLRRGNLPAELPPLYGRNDDIATLARRLQSHRVVSVVGPAGIGKTRLAQAVAQAVRASHADGVWLAELAPLADPLLVVPTVARLLGHAIAPNEGALASLVVAMREQRLLLVLDNCEHLLPAVAALATRIVADAAQVRLLVTSQEPLHIAEECVDRVNALAVPPTADTASALNYGSVQLFAARAQAADPRFAMVGDDVVAAVEICRRLDGIPLAIELAAARVPLLGVRGLCRRLDEQLKLLAGGARTALPRHQTLRAALQWSHALLSADEQKVFERLGVFVGSFSLEAAQQVACDDAIDGWAVLDHLAALVDKSMVLVEGSSDIPRYRLLESSRAFALERLAAAGAIDSLRRRHAQAIADILMGDAAEGPGARLHRVDPDLDNARAATAWATGPTGDRQIAIALVCATDLLWEAHGRIDEGSRFYRTVEPWVDASTPPHLAARYWYAVCNLRSFIGMEHQARAGLQAAELFRSQGERLWAFRALHRASVKLSWLRHAVAAEKALAEMQALHDPAWPSWTRAAVEHDLGHYNHFALEQLGEARRHFEAAIELERHCAASVPDGYHADLSDVMLLAIDSALGAFEAVVCRADDLLARKRVSDTSSRLVTSIFRGGALAQLGYLGEAEASLRAAVPQLTHATGSAGWTFNYVAYLLVRQGRLGDAARILGCIDAFPGSAAFLRTPSGRRFYADAQAVVALGLSADTLERLRSEGRVLTETEAIALVFPMRA
jgi:predicted ATPase/DNA-binding winged helix-turn-helix (wHTH) protein